MSGVGGQPGLRTVALFVWATGIVLSVSASVLSAGSGRPPEVFLPIGLSAAAYATAGAVIFVRRPENLIGVALLSLSIVPAGLVVARYLFPVLAPLNIAFGFQANALPLAYVVLSFPSGRLRERSARWVMALAAAAGIVGGLAELVTIDPTSLPPSACIRCTTNPVRLFDSSLYPVLQDVNATVFVLIAVAFVVLVVRRWRRSRGVTRAALTPILVGGIVIAAANALFFLLALAVDVELPLSGQFLLLLRLVIPIGLAAVLLRFYAARTNIARALVRMGRGTTIGALQSELRRSLGDPEMTIYRWTPASMSFVDGEGSTLDLANPGTNRAVMVVDRDEHALAAVLHDEALESDRELLQVVAETVRHSLDVTDLRDELVARGGDVARLPRGQVAFLFGDVERSTQLLDALGEAYAGLLATLRAHVRAVANVNGGQIVDMRADECFLVFPDAGAALAAAIALQRQLRSQRWPQDVEVRLRMGLHSGRPELTPDGYVGLDVHRAARVMTAAMGGQTIASQAFALAVRDRLPDSVELVELGSFALRGIPDEETLYEVNAPPN